MTWQLFNLLFRACMKVAFIWLLRVRIFPSPWKRQGSYIFVMNHIHRLDAMIALSAISHPVSPVIARDVITGHPLISAIVVGLAKVFTGAIPISRNTYDSNVAAFKTIEYHLKKGKSILIAPEGTRSKDGQLGSFNPGVTLVALRTKSSIVPIVTYGYLGMSLYQLLRTPSIYVAVGKPFRLSFTYIDSRRAIREHHTRVIRNRVKALLPTIEED